MGTIECDPFAEDRGSTNKENPECVVRLDLADVLTSKAVGIHGEVGAVNAQLGLQKRVETFDAYVFRDRSVLPAQVDLHRNEQEGKQEQDVHDLEPWR